MQLPETATQSAKRTATMSNGCWSVVVMWKELMLMLLSMMDGWHISGERLQACFLNENEWLNEYKTNESTKTDSWTHSLLCQWLLLMVVWHQPFLDCMEMKKCFGHIYMLMTLGQWCYHFGILLWVCVWCIILEVERQWLCMGTVH